MNAIVIVIVLVIIGLQVWFFRRNLRRMKEFRTIFENEGSWRIIKDEEKNVATGISGEGNEIFVSIQNSINKYLSSNVGSVIDFHLLKDAADRHCDSVENDITTLTPVPLYLGLAGTMAGVILGLGSLIMTGSITDLLSSGSDNFMGAADGVNDLLTGVAWAMVASICGILLTTISSLLFKKNKLAGEAGKNSFLAWLQAKLLPELPSDTSEALNRLVKNLNRFNRTFAENTGKLDGTLKQVNESYRIQAQVIQAVHDMDVMKMAKANVSVLQELQQCTEKLEEFNLYLDSIHGYTDAIYKFTAQFESETRRLGVLEEIQQFFMRHRAEIAKTTANADQVLQDALQTLKDNSHANINDFRKYLIMQSEEFKQILGDEKSQFEQFSQELRVQFNQELTQMPTMQRQLAEISQIPSKIDALIERMEKSNKAVAASVVRSLENRPDIIGGASEGGESGGGVNRKLLPDWASVGILFCMIIICICSIVNLGINMKRTAHTDAESDDMELAADSAALDTTANEVVVDTTVVEEMPAR